MNTMDKFEIKAKLQSHKLWLGTRTEGLRADFSGKDVSHANLRKAQLNYSRFRSAKLRWAKMQKASLRGALIDSADMVCVTLSQADLTGADLTGSNLGSSTLFGTNLSFATLCNANLRHADLRFANLTGADLTGADLTGAQLKGANLHLCDFGGFCHVSCITGAPLYQVSGVGIKRRALTLCAQGTREEWRWFAGCFAGSELELRTAVAKKYKEGTPGFADYMDAIDYLAILASRHQADFLPPTNHPSTPQP